MGVDIWDAPPTEEEINNNLWDAPPTEEEINSSTPMSFEGEGTLENPKKLVGDTPSNIPDAVSSENIRDSEGDISQTTAEVKQAITTVGDQLGWTSDSKKSMTKFNKEITRVLKEKGYKVENRGDTKVAIDSYGNEIPIEEGMVDSVIASSGEMLGGIGAGIASGAAGGSVGGPWGALGGGIIGGAAGAIAGDQYDVSKNADKHGIEISDEERLDRMLEVGVADAIGGVGGVAGPIAGKAIGRLGAKVIGTTGRRVLGMAEKGATDVFTSIDKMSKPMRDIAEELMSKSDMSKGRAEQVIEDYAKTVKGGLTNEKAVEALAKAGDIEGLGYARTAMDDVGAKGGVIKESTKRNKVLQSALDEDEELADIYSRNTVTPSEGSTDVRRATNWGGVYGDMKDAGFDEADPIMKMVKDNVTSLGGKEKKLFNSSVSPTKTKEGVASSIPGIEEAASTARSSMSSQLGATQIILIDKALNRLLPNLDTRIVNTLKKSMAKGMSPVGLEKQLVKEGVDKAKAKRVATEVADAEAKAYKENIAFDAKEADNISKQKKAIVADATKKAVVKEKAIEKMDNAAKTDKSNFIKRMGREAKKAKHKAMNTFNKQSSKAPTETRRGAVEQTPEQKVVRQQENKVIIDEVLAKEVLTEKDRPALDLAVVNNSSTEKTVKAAKKKLGELNRATNSANMKNSLANSDLDDVYKEFKESKAKVFGDYMISKKVDKEEVKKYLVGQPKNQVNDRLRAYVDDKKIVSKPKPKRESTPYTPVDHSETLGKEGQKAYEKWALGIRERAKARGTLRGVNTSLKQFLDKKAGRSYNK